MASCEFIRMKESFLAVLKRTEMFHLGDPPILAFSFIILICVFRNRRLCCALVTCFLLLNATLVVEWANAFSGSTLIYWQLRSSTSLLKVDNATDMAVKQFARYVENNTSTSVQTNVESPFTETKNERSFVNFVETRRRESPSIVTTRTPVPRNTNKERQNTHPGTYPSPKEFNCSNSREVAHVENILCMVRWFSLIEHELT